MGATQNMWSHETNPQGMPKSAHSKSQNLRRRNGVEAWVESSLLSPHLDEMVPGRKINLARFPHITILVEVNMLSFGAGPLWHIVVAIDIPIQL